MFTKRLIIMCCPQEPSAQCAPRGRKGASLGTARDKGNYPAFPERRATSNPEAFWNGLSHDHDMFRDMNSKGAAGGVIRGRNSYMQKI